MNLKPYLISSAILSLVSAASGAIVLPSGNTAPTGDPNQIITGQGTCFNGQLTVTCTACEGEYVCESFSSTSGNILMIGGLRFHSWSNDYTSSGNPSGCSPCGSSMSAGSSLPSFSMVRYIEPISYSREHLTFGKLHGMQRYDQTLSFAPNKSNVTFFDYGGLLTAAK